SADFWLRRLREVPRILPDLVAATGPMVGLGVAERQPASGDGRRSGLAVRGPDRSAKPSRLSPGFHGGEPGTRCGATPHSPIELTPRRKGCSMYHVVILTALTATSGLFGHGRYNTVGWCGRPMVSSCAPRTSCSPCQTYAIGHWRGQAARCATCPTA